MKKIFKNTSILKHFCFLSYMFWLFPIKRNKIILNNFNGKGYGENPKYIAEELLGDKELDLVWIVDNKKDKNDEMPAAIRRVKKLSVRYFYELATAKVWISNVRLYSFIRKRKKQIYIQTWHGGMGLKQIEKDAVKSLNRFYIDSAKNDSKMADYMVSNCKYRTEQYKKSFWYNGKIIECGIPKNDIYFKQNKKIIEEKVYKKLDISPTKKILLYAPTYRSYDYDYDLPDIEKIIKMIGDDYVIVYRLHPNVKNKVSELAIDASSYPDINDLLISSDILVTDYSSILFDYANLERPIILYIDDYDKYYKSRGLNVDVKKLPITSCSNKEQLIAISASFDYEKSCGDTKMLLREIETFDTGHASETIARIIKDEIRG